MHEADIQQVTYVPDAGHAKLIDLCLGDNRIDTTALTNEMEGVGMACGAWLGGQSSVLLMQSSGAGSCINAMSALTACRFQF